MAQRFCTSCGSPTDDQLQRFCTKCGAPLNSGQTMAVDSREQTPPPADGGNRRGIAIIIAAALVAIGIIAIALINPFAPHPSELSASSSQEQSTGGGEDPSSSSADSDSSTQSKSEKSSSTKAEEDNEEELYEELVDIYETMGVQADHIKGVASTLNNTIFVSDWRARQQASDEAHDLMDDVESQLNRLEKLSSSNNGSRYSGDIATLVDLQQDLYKRIKVMCEAWDISLDYSNPKDHESAIKKPLGKDNDSNGVNIYKKDFEARYPDARPER